MIEYWIVYDDTTGAIRWPGTGPEGMADAQVLPEGTNLVIMPFEAFAPITAANPDFSQLKAYLQGMVDEDAGKLRARYITVVPGQTETYLYKADEARAWTADNSIATPFLGPEAAARGMSVGDLAAEVLANEGSWRALGGKIEGARLGAKNTIASAETIKAMVDAAKIDWAAVVTAA